VWVERHFFEMNFLGKAAMRAGVVFLAVFLGFASPVARAAVTVPFVGCAGVFAAFIGAGA